MITNNVSVYPYEKFTLTMCFYILADIRTPVYLTIRTITIMYREATHAT